MIKRKMELHRKTVERIDALPEGAREVARVFFDQLEEERQYIKDALDDLDVRFARKMASGESPTHVVYNNTGFIMDRVLGLQTASSRFQLMLAGEYVAVAKDLEKELGNTNTLPPSDARIEKQIRTRELQELLRKVLPR
jgi:hypothetical protein